MTDTNTRLFEVAVRELTLIRQLLTDHVNAQRAAEAEVPERMRRFANYMHNVHDISYMYQELGQIVPEHILRETERCDDRFRQLLVEYNTDAGAFEKVRREMAQDKDNRWDHTRQLTGRGKHDAR